MSRPSSSSGSHIREEVADRGLRGGRQFGIAAQARVEGVEALELELALVADVRRIAFSQPT